MGGCQTVSAHLVFLILCELPGSVGCAAVRPGDELESEIIAEYFDGARLAICGCEAFFTEAISTYTGRAHIFWNCFVA